ncbi:MAG: hypothetical protein J6B26_01790 [Agathobacter sp.]|nr:hypothetical protein [Agathobacter sp.]
MARKAVKATEVKAAEVKAAEVKEVEVKETAKAEVVADKAEEKAAKKAPAKRAAKTTAKKVKEEAKIDIVLQYQTLEVSAAAVEEKVKAQFVAEGHRAGCIKTMSVYVKPEEYKAYYVINDKFEGFVWLP